MKPTRVSLCLTHGLAFSLFALLAAACGQKAEGPAPVRPVITQEVTAVNGLIKDVYSGELRARQETELAFRINGKIQRRLVDAGTRVERGQLLATLDPIDARLAADAAKAQVSAAESDLAFAKAELDRNRDLLARNFISKTVYDNKLNAYNAALARVNQAKAQAGINLNQAGYTLLTTDAAGVVINVAAEAGQVVNAGQTVIRVAKDGDREVAITIPESKIATVKVGQEARAWLWNNPQAMVPARIREVNAVADPVTRTYLVRVTVPELPPGAQLGMTASVAIGTPAEPRIVVPLTAIVKKAETTQASVWVVNRETRRVAMRPVTVSAFGEQGATLASGLKPGELIVIAGAHKLLPDQEVKLAVVSPSQAPAPQPSTAPPAVPAVKPAAKPNV
jgi:membrane fusion protein, multidrug efflux system